MNNTKQINKIDYPYALTAIWHSIIIVVAGSGWIYYERNS